MVTYEVNLKTSSLTNSDICTKIHSTGLEPATLGT